MNCASCTYFIRTTSERGVCRWAVEVRAAPFWFTAKPFPIADAEGEIKCAAWERPGRRMKVKLKEASDGTEIA